MAIKQKVGCPATPGKKRYEVQRHAISAALKASRRSGLALRVYRCPDCTGWHLTKRPLWHPSYGPRGTFGGAGALPVARSAGSAPSN